MSTFESLKALSLAQLQEAFSKALSELSGQECLVVLHELRFETGGVRAAVGNEIASFTGDFQLKKSIQLSDLL